MDSPIKIVIDTKGSDNGPSVFISGAALALEKLPDIAFVLVGDEEFIAEECSKLDMPMDRVEILDAKDEVTNFDKPGDAIFKKPNSSMLVALKALSERDDLFGMISAGNTGVLLAGGMRHLSKERRVRPCLSAVLPCQDGSFTCLVDTGATIDCIPEMLHHFALLGSEFMRDTYRIENPKVALLSNGAEASKGNALVKETFPILAEDERLCFIGNIEGNRALSGECDVLVCDGFAGNQVFKVTEGTATRIITDIVKYAKREGSNEVLALAKHLMSVYDIGSLGGGNILGLKKPVIKARGNSGEKVITSISEMFLNMAQNKEIFDSAKNTI